MSYILDALRKSETERSLGEYVPAKDPAFDITDRSPSRLRSILVVAAVGAAAGLGLFWLVVDRPASVAVPSTVSPPVAGAPVGSTAEKGTAAPSQRRALAQEAIIPSAPADRKPLAAAAKQSSSPAPARAKEDNAVKFLRAMPATFRSRLPKLEINIHVYSPDLAQQILYVNNHEVKPGQRVDGGAVLESITPDGAVLRLDDTRFKLPRPS